MDGKTIDFLFLISIIPDIFYRESIWDLSDRYLPKTCRYDKLDMDTRFLGYDEKNEVQTLSYTKAILAYVTVELN